MSEIESKVAVNSCNNRREISAKKSYRGGHEKRIQSVDNVS